MRIPAIAFACLTLFPSAKAVEFMWAVTGSGGAPSSLYAINPTNGQALGLVGSTGTVCLSGLAIQPGTGALLAAQGQQTPTGADSKRFYRIDKATGAAAALGTLDPKYAISDLAMRADGTLYAFGIGSTVKKLMTINQATGAPTEIGNTNNITNVSLTFGSNGVLYLVRTNGLFTVNPATGMMSALVAALNGATTQIDNMMATSSSGVIYAGLRNGGSTSFYTLDPTTATTVLVGTAAGVDLCGIAFDNAGPPTISIKGKKKITTKKTTVTIKGAASSLLPLTVSAPKSKSAKVVGGSWTMKVKLKHGKNRVKLTCTDGFGQSALTKVTVVRD